MAIGALSRDNFIARTSLFYAILCVLVGIQLPFFPVWLAAKGLDAAQVGLVLAIPSFVRVISVPLATRAADRTFGIRNVLMLSSAVAALAYTGLGFAEGVAAILLVVVVVAFANTPAMALLDAYALRGLKARARAYGPVRLWGSVAFIAANIGAGLAFDLIAAKDLIWLMAASAIAIAAATLLLQPADGARPVSRDVSVTPLWRDRVFVLVMLSAGMIQASHAVYYGFSTLHWTAAGYDGVTIGLLWALGVIAEIILFALSGRLPPALSPLRLLMIGAAAAALRWSAMAFDPPGWTLPLLQLLHGLSFGATHLGTIAFVAHHAPEGWAATAQGYVVTVNGVLLGLCMMIAGILYEMYGSASYGAMTAAAMIGGVLAVIAARPTKSFASSS